MRNWERLAGSAFDVFVKNAADEQGVITYVRPDQKCLVRRGGFERQQKIRQIKRLEILNRCTQLSDLGEFL